MRIAIAFCLLVLLAVFAQAETNQERVRGWFVKPPASQPAQIPTPPVFQSPQQKSAPTVVPESPRLPSVKPTPSTPKQADRSKSAGRSQTGRSGRNRQVDQKSAVVPPPSGGGQRLPEPSATGFTCAEARQGVGLSCFIIRQNAYRYERLSSADKARADACLTASERASIKACFR